MDSGSQSPSASPNSTTRTRKRTKSKGVQPSDFGEVVQLDDGWTFKDNDTERLNAYNEAKSEERGMVGEVMADTDSDTDTDSLIDDIITVISHAHAETIRTAESEPSEYATPDAGARDGGEYNPSTSVHRSTSGQGRGKTKGRDDDRDYKPGVSSRRLVAQQSRGRGKGTGQG